MGQCYLCACYNCIKNKKSNENFTLHHMDKHFIS